MNTLLIQKMVTDFSNHNSETKSVFDNIVIRSPIRFPGSKFQGIKFIKLFIDSVKHDEYREPFFGGGAVFFAKPKVKFNWVNDLSSDLITTFRVISDENKRGKLIEKLQKEESPKKTRHQEMKDWIPSNEIDTAYRYYYLNRTSYSGIMKKPAWGFHPTKSVQPNKWGERIKIAGKKLSSVKITKLDFEEVIKAQARGRDVLLFVDPPYYKADQKRAYEHSFREEDHIRVAKVLKNTKYKFILTYDNCKEIKDLYSWANIYEVSWRYHTANSNRATRKMGNELIITNFDFDKKLLNKIN